MVKFLKEIRANEQFLVVCSINNGQPLSLNDEMQAIHALYQANDKYFPFVKIDSRTDAYNIYYWPNKQGHNYEGESKKEKRKCRFCGKKMPEVTFKKKAHAISESLGNTRIFCYDECDACNEKFSAIEQELFNHYGLNYYIFQPNGKKGKRKLKGKQITIDDSVRLKLDCQTPSKEEMLSGLSFNFTEPSMSYIPQNIYKCLCKFAVNLIDSSYLPRIKKTIDWLSSDQFYTELPPVWACSDNSCDHPTIGIFIRKEEATSARLEFVVKLHLLNMSYIYTFPFVDDCSVVLNDHTKQLLSDDFFTKTSNKHTDYFECEYVSRERQSTPIQINLSIEEGGNIVEMTRDEYETKLEDILNDTQKVAGILISDNK